MSTRTAVVVVAAVLVVGLALVLLERTILRRRHVAVQVREPCTWTGNIHLPLRYSAAGIHTVRVDLDRGDGVFRSVDCVVDTGSRFLTVASDPGDGRASWVDVPATMDTIRYGTQRDRVRWFRVPVRMAGHRVCNEISDLTVAVSHQRSCGAAGCFDVLGLADDDDPACFLRQVGRATARAPSFCVAMGRDGAGYVSVNLDCDREPGRVCALRPGFHYVVDVGAIRIDGALVGGGVAAPTRLMIDTGSNMLGAPPDFARELVDALRGGAELRLGLRDTDGAAFDYVVDRDTYMQGDDILVDANVHLTDVIVIGSMFLRGKKISVDARARTIKISDFP